MRKPEEYRELSEHYYCAGQLASNAVVQRRVFRLAESYALRARRCYLVHPNVKKLRERSKAASVGGLFRIMQSRDLSLLTLAV
jgi:hypothetical protein